MFIKRGDKAFQCLFSAKVYFQLFYLQHNLAFQNFLDTNHTTNHLLSVVLRRREEAYALDNELELYVMRVEKTASAIKRLFN